MAITGVSNTDLAAAADAQVTRKTGNQALGKDDFMKLLTAQLKNQDPNNPTDTKELVTQLSQLTSVEQLTQMSSKLDTLTAATNSSAANASSNLIGKKVIGVADTVALQASGKASAAVNFPDGKPDKATVSVVNDAGRVVRTFDMSDLKAGVNTITWDGNDNGGDRVQSGTYTFQVAAKDRAGTAMQSSMNVSGTVSAVYYDNGAPELEVGGGTDASGKAIPGTRIPLSNLTSIGQ